MNCRKVAPLYLYKFVYVHIEILRIYRDVPNAKVDAIVCRQGNCIGDTGFYEDTKTRNVAPPEYVCVCVTHSCCCVCACMCEPEQILLGDVGVERVYSFDVHTNVGSGFYVGFSNRGFPAGLVHALILPSTLLHTSLTYLLLDTWILWKSFISWKTHLQIKPLFCDTFFITRKQCWIKFLVDLITF